MMYFPVNLCGMACKITWRVLRLTSRNDRRSRPRKSMLTPLGARPKIMYTPRELPENLQNGIAHGCSGCVKKHVASEKWRNWLMKRNIYIGAAIVAVVVALGVGSVVLGRRAAVQAAGVQAPQFEVDPMWPKPMPN